MVTFTLFRVLIQERVDKLGKGFLSGDFRPSAGGQDYIFVLFSWEEVDGLEHSDYHMA